MSRKLGKKKKSVVILIFISLLIMIYYASRKVTNITTNTGIEINKSVNSGISAIKKLESESVLKIQEDIENIKLKQNQQDNKYSDNKNKNIDYNKLFENSVIMGDSISESLIEFDILDSSSVVAYKGRTTLKAIDDVDTIVNLSPSNIIMTYGMNDAELYNNSNDFTRSYEKLIGSIQEKLPDSKIYITSIMPVQQNAIDKKPMFNNIESFNIGLEKMCNKLGIKFINVETLESKYYEPDCIHIKFNAYPIWLNSIARQMNL